jgi:hypothetical protein
MEKEQYRPMTPSPVLIVLEWEMKRALAITSKNSGEKRRYMVFMYCD